jgi:hypothetical protein
MIMVRIEECLTAHHETPAFSENAVAKAALGIIAIERFDKAPSLVSDTAAAARA